MHLKQFLSQSHSRDPCWWSAWHWIALIRHCTVFQSPLSRSKRPCASAKVHSLDLSGCYSCWACQWSTMSSTSCWTSNHYFADWSGFAWRRRRGIRIWSSRYFRTHCFGCVAVVLSASSVLALTAIAWRNRVKVACLLQFYRVVYTGATTFSIA